MEIRHSRSATRHRISRQRSAYVVRNAEVHLIEPAPKDSPHSDERHVFLGPDSQGVVLEVMAVQTVEYLVVIHAMQIRSRYKPYLR